MGVYCVEIDEFGGGGKCVIVGLGWTDLGGRLTLNGTTSLILSAGII